MEEKLNTLRQVTDEITSRACMDCGCFSQMERELKKEAIKWVKGNSKEDLVCLSCNKRFHYSKLKQHVGHRSDWGLSNVREFIKHFFNLAEDDLK